MDVRSQSRRIQSGYARANFTPTDSGSSTVRANVTGVTAIVTFTITTGTGSGTAPGTASGARDSGTGSDTRDAGTGDTPGTSRAPVVHVVAASRPPMLWVEEGAIYALVGASPQRFAPSVDNALNIAVGGGKVYWTEKTGDTGTINSANVNGSDVTELTSIRAVTDRGLPLTQRGANSIGRTPVVESRVRTSTVHGITNVAAGGPEHGSDGSRLSPMVMCIGRNMTQRQCRRKRWDCESHGSNTKGFARYLSTGSDTPGSLAIGNGKVYWTEMTG